MRPSAFLCRHAAAVLALGCALPGSLAAQTFAATTGTEGVINTPSEPRAARVTVPAHHRSASDTLIYGRVRDGVYTVDGMVAKVQLNYDVDGANFLYLFVPGVGTAVLSMAADPNNVTAEAKLRGNELTFMVGDHHFKLTGVALVNGKGSAPEHLYVRLDRSAWRLNRQPMVGFGNVAELPYAWPGALPPASVKETEESRVVPPVPASLLPSTSSVVPRTAAPAAVDPALLRPVALR